MFFILALTDTITENVQLRFVNEVWTDKLNDENSTEFRALASKVSKAVSLRIFRSFFTMFYMARKALWRCGLRRCGVVA